MNLLEACKKKMSQTKEIKIESLAGIINIRKNVPAKFLTIQREFQSMGEDVDPKLLAKLIVMTVCDKNGKLEYDESQIDDIIESVPMGIMIDIVTEAIKVIEESMPKGDDIKK